MIRHLYELQFYAFIIDYRIVSVISSYFYLRSIHAEILFCFYNNMIKIILAAFLIIQAARAQEVLSLPSFSFSKNNYDETLKCYLQQKAIKGSLLMVLSIQDLFYSWYDTNNLTDPQKAYEMYQQPVHVIVVTDTRIDHSLYGQLAVKALRGQPIKALWVVASNGSIKSCDQLKGFLRDLRDAVGPSPTIGIYTGIEYWSNIFDEKGCPQVPQQYPLFYQSFYFKDRFYPFAGWKKAQYMINSTVTVQGCKVFGTKNQVEYYTKPKQ